MNAEGIERKHRKAVYSGKVRRGHFKQFMSLSPEEQLTWSISHAYEMLSLLPEDVKSIIEEFRNGTKKFKPPVQNGYKGT